MLKKGEAPILSGVLYTGIVIVGITIVLLSLKPYLEVKKAEMEIDASFLCIDSLVKSIKEVMYAVPGSSKEIRCSFKRGVLSVLDNALIWDVEIPVSYDLSKFKGWDVVQYINATEENGYYVLYNRIVEVNISAVGNAKDMVLYNLTEAFNYLKNKKHNLILSKKIRFFLDNESCEVGYGYTYLKDKNAVGMHIEPAECMPYDVIFVLDSEFQDFVRIFVSF
ncbi:MAG: hypothetical protein GXN99_01575 [Candidatus Nanohaloarchaeota archaeon]|nr:hypothetical protein [Candidatus Nanohaloarchaeota archaeon]